MPVSSRKFQTKLKTN